MDAETLTPAVTLIVIAYLFGSISSAIVVCKLMRLPDPRGEGSGNPGATNVLRLGGKKAALITLLGDALKGFIPVLVAMLLNAPIEVASVVALAAFLGHLYPVFFGFRGGKGVATAFGVLFGLGWQIGLIVMLVWLIVAALSRYSSLGGLTSMATAPFVIWYYFPNLVATGVFTIMAALLFWRHRSNIKNLIAGTEGKIGKK